MRPDLTVAPDLDQPAPRQWTREQGTALGLWTALARCYSTYARAGTTKVQEYGLTGPQFRTLEALYHLGPLPLGELADKLLVTGGNVTYVVDRLEDKGLVSRCRDSADRRIVHATLTASGRALFDEVFPGCVGYVEHLSRHLSTEEQETMRLLLERLGKGIAGSDL